MGSNREIGQKVVALSVGDRVSAKNNRLSEPVTGTVISKNDQLGGEEVYEAIVELDEPVESSRTGRMAEKAELRANWRDIPEDDDQPDEPYTGLLLEPFDDTSPYITSLEILN